MQFPGVDGFFEMGIISTISEVVFPYGDGGDEPYFEIVSEVTKTELPGLPYAPDLPASVPTPEFTAWLWSFVDTSATSYGVNLTYAYHQYIERVVDDPKVTIFSAYYDFFPYYTMVLPARKFPLLLPSLVGVTLPAALSFLAGGAVALRRRNHVES